MAGGAHLDDLIVVADLEPGEQQLVYLFPVLRKWVLAFAVICIGVPHTKLFCQLVEITGGSHIHTV